MNEQTKEQALEKELGDLSRDFIRLQRNLAQSRTEHEQLAATVLTAIGVEQVESLEELANILRSHKQAFDAVNAGKEEKGE